MYTLRHAGTEKALSGWAVTGASLTYNNQLADQLDLTVSGTARPWADGDTLDLLHDGVRVFSGRVTKLPRVGSSAREARTYTISGPWWYLEALTYEQPYNHYDESGALVSIGTTRIALNCGGSFLQHIPLNEQIARIVGWCITAGAPLALAYPTTLAPVAPIEEAVDISCAEALRRELRWAPDSVAWWDYAAAVPTLHLDRRAALPALTIDLAAGDLVAGEWSITPRHDLVAGGVRFVHAGLATVDGAVVTRYYEDVAGNLADVWHRITHTFTLAFNSSTGRIEAPTYGMANAYWLALQQVPYEGMLPLRERECSLLGRPGHALNCLGDDAEFSTMRATVQTSSYDLFAGTSRLTFGPNTQLGPADLLALADATKSKGVTTTFGDTYDGSPVTPPGPAATPTAAGTGSDPLAPVPMQAIILDVCLAGQPTQVAVYGAVV